MDQLRRIRENISPSQLFFLLIMIPMASFAPILYESCSNFYKYRELERPDYDNAKWSDFLLVLVISPFFTLAKHIANKLSRGYFHSKLKVKYQGEALELKINKSTRNFFKVFYFGFITLLGFYVYSDTNYQSGLMFGSGNLRYVSSDWPYTKIPRLLKLYYMIGMSYHFEDSVHHLFNPAQNDFFEMLLHHYITLLLITGSYMTNKWNHGISVMIQMDNGDSVGGMIKAFMDFVPVPLVLINYFVLLYCWIYFRVFIFAYEVIWQGSLIGQWRIDFNSAHQGTFQVLLLGLLLLNVYWTILFLKMGLRFLRKGEVKDLQNPVEDKGKHK